MVAPARSLAPATTVRTSTSSSHDGPLARHRDTLTVKVVMRKLEEADGLSEGTLKPHKAKIKEVAAQ